MKAFVSLDASLGALDAGSVATLIATASDIALVMDADGTLRDLAFQSEELAADLADSGSWLGRPIGATLALDSRPKVANLLRDALAPPNEKPKWRHLNHLTADGRSVPVLYCAVQVGEGGRIVAFGRDLRAMSLLQQRLVTAQESLERDYARMRDVEMRYRLLFQLSSEAVLILDPAKLRVVEANPAARRLFGGTQEKTGTDPSALALKDIFHAGCLEAVRTHLLSSRTGEPAEDMRAQLVIGGADVMVAASLFRQDSATLLLVRISAAPDRASSGAEDVKHKLLRIVESAPDGFVVTDSAGNILTANAAFLDMAGLVTEEQARGEPLDRWVGHNGVEIDVLMSNLRQRGSVRFFTTTVQAEDAPGTQVEISAVAVGNGSGPSFGFAIRNIGPRLQTGLQSAAQLSPPASSQMLESGAPRMLPRSVEQLTELIGRVSLKDLVRESTDVIEKMCIEAALELTGDNRASAAEMLGLSRQSLYVKLRRYGLGDLATHDQN